MPVLSNLIVRIGASTDDFDKKVNASLGKIKRFGATISEAGQALAIGFSAPVLAAGSAALMAATQMESLEKGLAATMKSTAAAATELERLKEVSKLPGLGLKEAVQGSIRLQTLGSSADESRRIMRELGNALAVVGGGKEDFSEVIRQLSQMAAVGKVTKENLDPIVERIPQIAAIIKDKFGPQALGDPAKTFEAMGMSAQQFIGVVVSELEKGGRAGGDLKTSMENLRESVEQTAAEFGKSLLPIGKEVVDTILNPMVERAKAAADAFNRLSPETKALAVEFGAVSAAIPVALVVLGTLIEKVGVVGGAITKLVGALKNMGVTAAGLGKAGSFALLATAIYNLLEPLTRTESALANQAKAADDNRKFLSGLTRTYQENLVATGQLVPATDTAYESILNFGRGIKKTEEGVKVLTGEKGKLKEVVDQLANAFQRLGVTNTTDAIGSFVLARTAMERITEAYQQGKASTIDVQRAQEALGEAYKKFIVDVGGVPPKMEQVGISFDFARERALAAIGDIQMAASAARNIELGRMTVPGDANDRVLTGSDTARAAKRNADMIRIMAGEVGKDWSKTQQAISRQVSTIVTDLSRGIADVIISGGKVGEVFERIGKQIASSLIRTVIEGGINQVVKALGGLLTKFGGLGKVIGGIFGGGGGGGAAAGGGGGGAAGVGGSVMGMASGGILGMVTGIGSLVSGIVGNFQMAGMNKTLDLIEKEVRYSQIHLLHILEKNNEYLPKLKDIHDSMIRTEGRQMAMAGNNNVTINISATGDTRTLLDAITRELKQLGVIPA